jgi:DNA-binding NtrC family response regulator
MGKCGNILVVDDELGPRASIKAILESNYNVYTAESGRAAVETIKEYPIDIVTLDLWMPDMDGLETLKNIKEYRPDVRVILISGFKDTESAAQASDYGVYEYITKPFDIETLLFIVKSALQSKQSKSLSHGIC